MRVTPHYTNLGTTNYSMVFGIPLPTQIELGGVTKNLILTQSRVGIVDADANDKMTNVRYYGWTTADPPALSAALVNDATARTAPGTYTYNHADVTVGGVYRRIVLYCVIDCTSAAEFDIGYADVEYYYD